MVVSVRPSVLVQPAAHLLRSTVQPSGPVRVLPSADSPHLLSLMRLTMASRSLAQSASHSVIDVGCGPAAVVAVAAVVPVAADVVVSPPAAVVEADSSSLSSPPQAAATRAR